MSQYEHIFNVLKKKYDVYSPAQHKGQCLSPYLVLKHNGVTPYENYTSERYLWDILIYIPFDAYSTLEDFAKDVRKTILSELYPMLRIVNVMSVPFYDDTIKAYMVSIQCESFTKNENIHSKLFNLS